MKTVPHHTAPLTNRYTWLTATLLFFASTSPAWASRGWTGILIALAWMFVAAPAGVITIGVCIWMVVELKREPNPESNYERRAKWAWGIIVAVTTLAILGLQAEAVMDVSHRAYLFKMGLLYSVPNIILAAIGYFLTNKVKQKGALNTASQEAQT